jgi:hypothetical protein
MKIVLLRMRIRHNIAKHWAEIGLNESELDNLIVKKIKQITLTWIV